MSDVCFVRVKREFRDGEPGVPYVVAEVVLGGTTVSRAETPDIGVYKADGTAERSAISLAKGEFARHQLNDIRRA